MSPLLAAIQLIAIAGLIMLAVIGSWHAGNKYWSSRGSR